jgi:hypothetical protein
MMSDEFATAGAGMSHLRAGLMSWVHTSDARPGWEWYKYCYLQDPAERRLIVLPPSRRDSDSYKWIS